MDWAAIWQYTPALLSATLVTLELLIASLVIGFILALILALWLEHKNNSFTFMIKTYIFVFRGTPMLVQIFIIYFGIGQCVWLQHSFLWSVFKYPFFCAALALVLNSAAYTCELFRGAIRALPAGEILAAKAFGMSTFQITQRIILPCLWRTILPAYSNEITMLLKGTSLASAITVAELTSTTKSIIGENYQTLTFLSYSVIIYLIVNFGLLFLVSRLHKAALRKS